MSGPLLEVEGLSVRFGADAPKAVDGVSFAVSRGEKVAIVGESGSGKSVTMLAVLRLLHRPPAIVEAERLRWKGGEILSMPPARLRALRGGEISMVFQEPMTALSPLHRVGAQLVEAGMLHGQGKGEAEARAAELLRATGLPRDKWTAYPHELSGGMRQRVMIGIALMARPQLVIADEPTTALDVTVQAQIFELLGRVAGEGTAMVLVTHDMALAYQAAERVLVMNAGKIVEAGPAEEVFRHPRHPCTRRLLASVPRLDG